MISFNDYLCFINNVFVEANSNIVPIVNGVAMGGIVLIVVSVGVAISVVLFTCRR